MSNFLPVVKLEFINDKQVPAVTSQQLAEAFGKQHAHVMRDIRETTAKCSKLFSASNFGLAEYLDEQGKSRPMYFMTKDAFTLLTMGYTGEKAMAFKIAYIARFNEMEEQLRTTSPLLPNFRGPIAAAEAWIVAERARLAELCCLFHLSIPVRHAAIAAVWTRVTEYPRQNSSVPPADLNATPITTRR